MTSHSEPLLLHHDDVELGEKDLELQEDDVPDTTRYEWLTPSTTIYSTILQKCHSLAESTQEHVFTKAFLVSLLPQYMQPGGLKACKKTHSTAYLDALRGYAALMVLHDHVYRWVECSYLELPWIRLLRDGSFAVNLFFLISGYVLTRRMLGLMRQRKDEELLQSLSSALLRRYCRLYLSAMIGSFICVTLFPSRLTGWPEPGTPRSVIYLDWLADTVKFCNPFAALDNYPPGLFHKYLTPLWTIPLEFRGSMLSFCFCAATYRMLPRQRAIVCWVLIALCYVWGCTYAAMFLLGTFFAEQSLCQEEAALQLDPETALATKSRPSRLARTGTLAMSSIAILVGCFLGSHLVDLEMKSPFPWQFLNRLVPFWWPEIALQRMTFWTSIGASLVFYGLGRCKTLQVPFNWSFSQYLGRLSFGLYVMHMPIDQCDWLWTARFQLRDCLGWTFWAWVLDYVMFLFVVIWAADYFTRIDTQVVKFCRWLEKKSVPVSA